MGNIFFSEEDGNKLQYNIEVTISSTIKKKLLILPNYNLKELSKELIDGLIEKKALIEIINLNGNEFTTIPEELIIKNINNLKELDFSLNKLKEITKEIGNCKNLIKINFSGNRIENLPIE
jgi:hypothetical protein